MRIERIEDKKFQITITEDDALYLADDSNLDFLDHKMFIIRFGNQVLSYITEACKYPHSKKPLLDIEL